jgi:nucleotide-binding universal stress UspA family protein
MAVKDILVHLDVTSRSKARLGVAAALAVRHGAHLTGLFTLDLPSADMFSGAAMPLIGSSPQAVVDSMRADAIAASEPVEAEFRERLRLDGIEGEWRLAEGHQAATVALHGRYADLTVVGQPNAYEPTDTALEAIPVTAMLTSGRPILVVPFTGDYPTVGQRILVAWNASREAARAVNDALPLLVGAQAVTVLAINPRRGIGGHGDLPAADIALHLTRHGVKAEAAHTIANDIPDGEALLSYAADVSADLIVAGGYGHSRVRELAFGGVTRTLLAEMTVPVFFSH